MVSSRFEHSCKSCQVIEPAFGSTVECRGRDARNLLAANLTLNVATHVLLHLRKVGVMVTVVTNKLFVR